MLNSVIWVAKDGDGASTVVRMAGGSISIISNDAVSERLVAAGDDLANAKAFGYKRDGHSYYCLSIPGTESTLVCDLTENYEWHERKSFKADDYVEWGRYKADCHAFMFGMNIVGSYDSGELFALDNQYMREGDVLIKRQRYLRPIYDEENDNYGRFSVFGLEMTVGLGEENGEFQNPVISMATSDDNGITFGYERPKSLGRIGKRLQQLRWKRCGMSRSRVFRITTMAPVEIVVRRGWVE